MSEKKAKREQQKLNILCFFHKTMKRKLFHVTNFVLTKSVKGFLACVHLKYIKHIARFS